MTPFEPGQLVVVSYGKSTVLAIYSHETEKCYVFSRVKHAYALAPDERPGAVLKAGATVKPAKAPIPKRFLLGINL